MHLTASASDRPSAPSLPSDLPTGTVLGSGRYEVGTVLGRGGNGVTYRCHDKESGREVAVKALSLRNLRDWKQLELFEREAQTLENLDHPGIPNYIDYFEEDTSNDRSFFLVQDIADGQSLEQMVARGWRADEAEVARVAQELLNILQYLGSRRPAVVHRDVKPANVIIEGGRTGGRVFLVDFGGVQAAAATGDMLGSTVVGTFGFMAPEAFRGAAQPASDLYGLGGTLLYMVSGRPPSAFPVDRMRINLSSVPMGQTLEAVVEGLLEPVLEDRLTADEALGLLTGKGRTTIPRTTAMAQSSSDRSSTMGGGRAIRGSVFGGRDRIPEVQELPQPAFLELRRSGPGSVLRKPPGSRIQVAKKGPKLIIDIPPAKFDGSSAATGSFAIAWNAFVAFWTMGALAGGGVLFALFSLPFWFAGAQLVKQAFGRQFIRERFEVGPGKWTLRQQLAGLSNRGSNTEVNWEEGSAKEASGRSADLMGAAMEIKGYINGVPQGQLVVRQGVESYILGEGLEPIEQEWLAEVINSHLGEVGTMRSGQGDVAAFAEDNIVGEDEDEGDSIGDRILYDEFVKFDKKLGVEVSREGNGNDGKSNGERR